MPFDLQAARKEGTDAEIAEYLASKANFDLEAARKEGNDTEIAEYLAGKISGIVQPTTPSPPAAEEPGFMSRVAGAARKTGEFLGMEKITDPFARMAAYGMAEPEERVGIGMPSVGEVGGAALQAGALALPYGRIAKAVGGGLRGAMAAGATGGYMMEAGEKIQKGEAPIPGATTAIGAAIPPVISGIGKAATLAGRGIKQTLGATTGTGAGTIEEAIKGTEGFKRAMRGQITGEEVVDNAKEALQIIKGNRAAAYQEKLKQVATNQGDIDIAPVTAKINELADRFNVKISYSPSGLKFDTSRIAMGKSGRKDILDVLKTLESWGGKEGDLTATGLDTLKRQLDDFYSDSSQARAFVAQLRNSVRDTVSKAVPEYGEMTKGYAEATNLIKDIESNLMLRKEGMSGRVTADQTLRRLTSAMRENFEMRKELLDALGSEAGTDIAGQVGGYAASQVIPRGLVGKMSAGSVGALAYLNPKFWPMLAASSPRAVNEFMLIIGQVGRAAGKIGKTMGGTPRFPGDIAFGGKGAKTSLSSLSDKELIEAIKRSK